MSNCPVRGLRPRQPRHCHHPSQTSASSSGSEEVARNGAVGEMMRISREEWKRRNEIACEEKRKFIFNFLPAGMTSRDLRLLVTLTLPKYEDFLAEMSKQNVKLDSPEAWNYVREIAKEENPMLISNFPAPPVRITDVRRKRLVEHILEDYKNLIVEVPRHRRGENKSYAFVTFTAPEKGLYVSWRLDGLRIWDKELKVSYAVPNTAEFQDRKVKLSNLPVEWFEKPEILKSYIHNVFTIGGEQLDENGIVLLNVVRGNIPGEWIAFILFRTHGQAGFMVSQHQHAYTHAEIVPTDPRDSPHQRRNEPHRRSRPRQHYW